MLRRTLTAAAATSLLLAGLAGQALAHPPATHLHCLTTPSGNTHGIARGVTLHANHDVAFHNFHSIVHLGPFHPVDGANPLPPLAPDFTAPYTCPPSP